jgi:AAA family ATP:ADP antiporter
VSVACLLAFWVVLTYMPERLALTAAYTFFVWFSVFNLFVVSVYRGFMADIWRLDQAKRLFGFIGAGGTLGALAGTKIASLLAKPIGSDNLIFVSVVMLELAVLCVARLVAIHRIDERTTESAVEANTPDVWRGLKLIARMPYLRWIAAYIFLYGLIGTFLYYQQGELVKATIPNKDERTQYFAEIEFWAQAITVALQFLMTAHLIRWFGITFALISQPVIAVLGCIAVWLAMLNGSKLAEAGISIGGLVPELSVVGCVMVLLRVSNFATAQPAREALYTVVEREVKYKSKSFIDTFVYRLGDAIGAWAFAGFQALGATLTTIALIAVPISGVWVFVGRSLGRRQREMTHAPADRAAIVAEGPSAARATSATD